jgi:copper(I)-binding protein
MNAAVTGSRSMRAIVTTLTLLLAVSAQAALAKDFHAGSLDIAGAWSRATPKGASVGAGYVTIKNTGTAPDRLIGGIADVAAKFEVHEMSMDNGVMKMRPVQGGLEIKPGETVELKPQGLHIMFVGLKKPLKQGDQIKATLEFEKAGKVEVDFDVSGVGGMGAPAGHDMPGMKHDMPGMKM